METLKESKISGFFLRYSESTIDKEDIFDYNKKRYIVKSKKTADKSRMKETQEKEDSHES